MPKSVYKTCFNVAFLVFNLCFLTSNLGWFGQGDPERDTHQEALPHLENADLSGPMDPGRRVLQEEKRGGSTTSKQTQGKVRPNPWEQDWDSRQVGAIANGVANGKGPLRRLWLVRHGDYHRGGTQMGHLTPTGIKQVEKTGQRLKDFGIRFDSFTSSTSVRAKETTEIISKYLSGVKVEWTDLLKEGRPVYPDPDYPQPVPNDKSFQEDGLRLDMAFRKYMHRSDPKVKGGTNELIVSHGNVIGYFALRGLQVPVERWLKVQVIQGSISMFEITSDGHFNVRILGDMGHISVNNWTG